MHSYNIVEKGSPLCSATNALILIHGRGADAQDILSLADIFTDEKWYIAAPQATNYTWYPYSFMVPSQRNEPRLSSAIDVIHRLLQNVLKSLSSGNIYIMGFSQGACLTAEVAARFARKYGGIVAFTGGLIGSEPNYEKYTGRFEGTNVYLTNSDNDPHIPESRSIETQIQMQKMGANVELEIFPGRPHK
jgi:phospholipase/carboxylesterase